MKKTIEDEIFETEIEEFLLPEEGKLKEKERGRLNNETGVH